MSAVKEEHVPLRLANVLAVCIVLVLAVPGAAFAHTAVLEQSASSDAPWVAPGGYGPARLFPGAQDIPDPSGSRAVYGTLAGGEMFDVYRFEASSDATLPVQLMVPATAADAAFRPSLIVIGGEGGATSAGALPPSILEHLRHVEATVAVLVSPDAGAEPRPTEYEPFVGETLYKGPSAEIRTRAYDVCYLIVWDPRGGTGDYRVAIGTAERFTAVDVVRTPVDILRIKLGLYGRHRFEWGFATLSAGAVAAAAALLVWLAARRRARRRTRALSGRTSREG